MKIIVSILFLLASLGVINGLLLGIYLWVKKEKILTDFYLGGLLIALSARIGKSVFFYFNDGPTDRLILQVGLSACLFIGPFFFLYIRSLSQKSPIKLSNVLLISLLVVITIVGLIYPYRVYPEIWNGYIIHGIYGVWVIFAVIGVWEGIKHIKENHNILNVSNLASDQVFIILLAVTFITLTYLSAMYISGFTYIWGAIAFTLFFYYMMVNVLMNKGKTTPKIKTFDPIVNASFQLDKLDELMEKEELYLNAKLKLNDLANASAINRNLLSRLLNEEYHYGFSNYVNEFRVKKSMELIQSRPELSLEGIGYEAGFNSKSSFFAAFKKIATCTPAKFKKQLKTA